MPPPDDNAEPETIATQASPTAPTRTMARPAMPLATQLAAGFALLLGLMLLIVTLAGWHLRGIQEAAARVTVEEWPRMLALQELAAHAQGHGAAMARLLTAQRTQRESIYPSLDAESAAMDRLTADLMQRVTEPQARFLVGELDTARRRYREVFAEVGVWIESGEPARAAALFAAEGQPALDQLITRANQLAQTQQRAVEAWQRRGAGRVGTAEKQLLAMTLLAFVVAAGLAWAIGRGVARPMAHLASTARRLAGGDLQARVDSLAPAAPREVERVGRALNTMAVAIAERNAHIEAIAFSDAVTGLPNRAGLLRLCGEAAPAADTVLLCDIARLAAVNDVFGPAAGDTLLRAHGQRLQSFSAARGWHCAHLGAGSFALAWRMARDSADPAADTAVDAAVEGVRHELLTMLARPVACAGVSIDAQFRCGWSHPPPPDPADDAGLADLGRTIREAEEALTDARRLRVDVKRFERVAPDHRRRQLVLLGSLRQAAADGGLRLWLQPKVTLTGATPGTGTPRCSGFEALVRWQHAEWGTVSPAEFVPFAEAAGMVGLITRSVLAQALRFLGRSEVQARGLGVSVNVSTADLLEPDFADWVARQATLAGAPLARLTLEITEGRLMEDAERALPVMHALRAAGVQWSIDDFGTGYSSLAYLQRLPVSELKVDRSFVDHVDATPARIALLRSIVQLGHGLGLEVTAEGIERCEEWAEVSRAGCDLAQGWLFARPMPADQVLGWLAEREPSRAPDHRRVAALT